MKRLLLTLAFAAAAYPQTITWTKQTGASAPNPPYFNQWHRIRYNSLNKSHMLWDNDQGLSLYGNAFYNLEITNPASATGLTISKLRTIGTRPQACSYSLPDFPHERSVYGNMVWDSDRNRIWINQGVCNLGQPDPSDSIDLWFWQAHYPLTTSESFTRVLLQPSQSILSPQIWGSGAYDPTDKLIFSFGFGTSAEPPKLYCTTDLNPTPGTLTLAQSTAGCTQPDAWTVLPVGSVTCGITPCTQATLPPCNAVEGVWWNNTLGKFILFCDTSALAQLPTPQLWSYTVATKTFTNITPAAPLPPIWPGFGGDPGMPMDGPDASGNYFFHQNQNFTVNITTPGSGYTPGTYAVSIVRTSGTCTSLDIGGGPRATYTVSAGGTVTSTTTDMSNVIAAGCPSATYNVTFPNGTPGVAATGTITFSAAHDWIYNPTAGVQWKDLGAFGGPVTTKTISYDPAWNSLIGYEYDGGNANLWIGQINTTVGPTVATVSLPNGTNGVAYSVQLKAQGNPNSFTWSCCSSGFLPGWATLDSNGLLHGTPNSIGPSTFVATVSNGVSPNQLAAYTVWVLDTTLSTALTVQEATYPGGATVSRTDEPFCSGVPVPDNLQLRDTSTLGLTGPSAYQFKVNARWPSGNIKWLKACGVIPTLTAGTTTTATLTNTGTGNGAGMATESGNVITVSTNGGTCGSGSAICFTVKRSGFNGIDTMRIGSTTVVATGTSQGFTVTGPDPTLAYPNNATCGTCTIVYTTAADQYASVVVEEDGPVMTVLRFSARHVNLSFGGVYYTYMGTIGRMYFYKGKSYVKITASLANADLSQKSTTPSINQTPSYGTAARYATAYKGHQGYELRIGANITGSLTYTIAADPTATGTGCTAGVCTGTLTSPGADNVQLVQRQSQQMVDSSHWCGTPCIPYTNDKGYHLIHNGVDQTSGSDTKYPIGWCDIADGSGVGIELGIYQMAALWPKSCEFNGGGTDVRIGIWPSNISNPYYTPWPSYQTHDLWVNFHATAPASLSNEFLKFQHYLVARADYTTYNNAAVFPYPMISSATEDSFYTTTANGANPTIATNKACFNSITGCIPDVGLTIAQWPLFMERVWLWPIGGVTNQLEARESNLRRFITRGETGRYIMAMQFYRFLNDIGIARSVGFNWATRAHFTVANAELDEFGNSASASANKSGLTVGGGFNDFFTGSASGQEHQHTYGWKDAYYMSGDESLKEGLMDAVSYYTNLETYQAGCVVVSSGVCNGGTNGTTNMTLGLFNSRAVGAHKLWVSRLTTFLNDIGQTLYASQVLLQGQTNYQRQVKPALCESGYPAACTGNTPIDGGTGTPWITQGVNPVRGNHTTPYSSTSGDHNNFSWCGVIPHNFLENKGFFSSILTQGLWELHGVSPTTWTDYNLVFDQAYGISRNALQELVVDDGTTAWATNGWRYVGASEYANQCTAAGETPEPDWIYYTTNGSMNAIWQHYWVLNQMDGGKTWVPGFKISLQKFFNDSGQNMANFRPGDDLYSMMPAAVISLINSTSNTTLNDVTITGFVDNGPVSGGESYTLSWTVPAGATSYRIKYASKRIVDWVGFNMSTNAFSAGACTPSYPTCSGDPTTTTPWFSATDAANVPVPTTGTQSFTFTAPAGLTNAAGNFSVKAYANAACNITTSSLANWTINVAYTSTALTSLNCGTGLSWSVTVGSLPTGMSLSAGGTLTGTPTVAGQYNFIVGVTGSSGTDSQPLSITIAAALAITTGASLPDATSGGNYTQQLANTGGTAPFTWTISAGTLSGSGLTLTSSGLVSGVATGGAATYNFTARITDAAGATTTKAFSVNVVVACVVPFIVTVSPLAPGIQNVPYTPAQFGSIGDTPVTWTATGVPSGMSLTTGGLLSGTPTVVGANTLSVTATNACGTQVGAPTAFTLQVNLGPTAATAAGRGRGNKGTIH